MFRSTTSLFVLSYRLNHSSSAHTRAPPLEHSLNHQITLTNPSPSSDITQTLPFPNTTPSKSFLSSYNSAFKCRKRDLSSYRCHYSFLLHSASRFFFNPRYTRTCNSACLLLLHNLIYTLTHTHMGSWLHF